MSAEPLGPGEPPSAAPPRAPAARRLALPAAVDLRRAWRAGAAVLAVVAAAALVTAVAFAAPARDALDFGFGGVPRTLGEAGAIFVHNARLMGAIAAAVLIVQSPRFERPQEPLGSGGELLRTVVDVALGAAVAVNAAVIGAAVGAYGGEMVVAMLPHGPVELVAYALALALYLRAREAPLTVRPALTLAGWALGLLALGALAEAFLHL